MLQNLIQLKLEASQNHFDLDSETTTDALYDSVS